MPLSTRNARQWAGAAGHSFVEARPGRDRVAVAIYAVPIAAHVARTLSQSRFPPHRVRVGHFRARPWTDPQDTTTRCTASNHLDRRCCTRHAPGKKKAELSSSASSCLISGEMNGGHGKN